MIKAIRTLTVFSVLLFAAVLLLIYAYLPIQVDLNVQGLSSMHKQTFFYQTLIAFLVVNILLRLVIRVGFRSLEGLTKAWINLLIFIVNFYFTLLVGFVGVWNNATSITPSSYSYLNFIGPVLLVIWVVGLIYFILQKSLSK